MSLRDYQVDGIERVRAALRAGYRAVLFALATGGGKTVVAAYIILAALARGSRVLFVAHRRELVHQAYAKLVAAGIEECQLGVMMASDRRRRPNAPIQIASIDTLRRRVRPPADLVVIDEAHRALSQSYRALLEEYPTARFLGLTATPYRADGRGLGELFDALVVIATPRLLIDQRYLVEPIVYTVPRDKLPDLSGVHVKRGDYDERELAVAINRSSLVGDIVDHWHKHARGVRTVCFAVNVEHSRHIAERFRAAGVPAEHLDGDTPVAERDAILARLEHGETLVVSNCNVLSEGWDQPSVKCAILARPTKSTGLYLQQAGRILRPYGNAAAVILDHSGNAIEHGLPQDDRDFSLESRKRRPAATSEAPCKTCDQCYAVLPAGTQVCPHCGYTFAPAETKDVAEVSGQLERIEPATPAAKRAFWDLVCVQAKERGYKRGWAYYRYKERFGVKPAFAFPEPTPGEIAPATTATRTPPPPSPDDEIVELRL